jgi:hypothetical protein
MFYLWSCLEMPNPIRYLCLMLTKAPEKRASKLAHKALHMCLKKYPLLMVLQVRRQRLNKLVNIELLFLKGRALRNRRLVCVSSLPLVFKINIAGSQAKTTAAIMLYSL